MCGIVGANSTRNVTNILIEGLKKLEYRGYDSAGLAIIDDKNNIDICKEVGKVIELEKSVHNLANFKGDIGIAHTRWATHGKPSKNNSHPHASESFCIVHNGVIENFAELKKVLINDGYKFKSDTDTEVIAHLLQKEWRDNFSIVDNIKYIMAMLKGAYAVAIISQKFSDKIVAVRSGSPLVIGVGIDENFISSDALSLLPVTNKFSYLDEGDIAIISKDNVEVFDNNGAAKNLEVEEYNYSSSSASKDGYKHYMLKEIYEQPEAVSNTILASLADGEISLDSFDKRAKELFEKTKHICIVACGTSYNAGMTAKYWIEKYAKVPCSVEIASEIRYRDNVVVDGSLFVSISQSGETADTLESLRKSKKQNYVGSMCICNVPNSSLVRESDIAFMTKAGVEIGVASTKAFTTQLVALAIFTLVIVKLKNSLTDQQIAKYTEELKNIRALVMGALKLDTEIDQISEYFSDKEHTIFLGRGLYYPIAIEGALKLKEISYIHAEAYPSGELKHGPLALVDKNMPIVAVVPNDELLDKTLSNLQEVHARGGKLILFVDKAVKERVNFDNSIVLELDAGHDFSAPVVFTIPLQLLSYHVAIIKGTDVDQPRNLAKSVTVE
ncbi:glutamine--fructose-6-phosphate transaminase (isomerizing) [Francisella tularensis]|uniref:Glutamine--fructose-6-phosphate aminotransferase [isomerizing] n=2 Tax=Francisella tularensis subsp. holarctica TaxID=119857 RepID=A0AAI8BI86_FRATH|nr:glutamine--fructose-6-phosphate transaminase (isomerizing) [Francisella tularensis]AFX70161.1 glucosamine--fructose-6-phosphate aminotransferase [Francisella tularensis subsp. holarctica F92]AHH45983.1 glucosamine--fructose-6-phosphate aminotransferase [Francisella tularensis subsp. holarctica PHIT-FT049]EBA52141.1 glucosamine-fructose-6-phosphate aminotransferase [Francisella tularensis subsp. holarctica 257]ABI82439.1 glutamine--fructose-6-phosphate transaminase (isomerizing) [Francisella 